MVTRLILFLLVALGGAGLTLQAVWNARLRASTTSPVLTSIISVLVTLLSLALVWASGATERGALPAFNALPRLVLFGGGVAAPYFVIPLIATAELGAAAVFSLGIPREMIAALIVDSTGV